MANARDRSEQSPGRPGTPARDRKVEARQAPARAEEAPAREADRYNQSQWDELGQPGLPRVDTDDLPRLERRDGKGDVPFCGWFSNDEEE